MKILIDECLPSQLKREFIGHSTFTVANMGWGGKKNGELLRLMIAAEFEVFLTADQNLRYQQRLSGKPIAIVVMIVKNTRLETLKPLIPAVLEKLKHIQSGEIVEIRG